jgi:hypothetical protein
MVKGKANGKQPTIQPINQEEKKEKKDARLIKIYHRTLVHLEVIKKIRISLKTGSSRMLLHIARTLRVPFSALLFLGYLSLLALFIFAIILLLPKSMYIRFKT